MHWDPWVKVENSGLIAAYAAAGSEGGASGITMFNGGNLVNHAGGSILAEGPVATALIFSRGDLFNDGVPEIRNAGRIEAFATDPTRVSIAILTGALTSEKMLVENSGIIRAQVAYRSDSAVSYSPPGQPSDELRNLAGGEIHGLIDTALGADIVINRGLIRGDLRMGEGDDLVDTVGGLYFGIADMGWGEDRFLGGVMDEAALGGRDGDWLDGGAGNDLLLGGHGDDVILGGAGNDGLYGEYGDDRIVSAGGDRIVAGAGRDRIEVTDLGFAAIDGGDGIDRLVLAIGADTLDLSSVLASGRVADIEEIETKGNQRLVIRAGDAAGLSGGEKALKLITSGTDAVELIGGWTEGNAVDADGTAYRRFTLGSETMLIAGSAGILIAQAPTAAAGGLDPVASGAAAPLAGSIAGMDLPPTTSTLTWHRMNDSEVVQAYEVWRSNGGLPVVISYDWTFTLTNRGLVESAGPGNGGAMVAWAQALRVENFGTMRAIGSGAEHARVIFNAGHSALVNDGLIEAIAGSGIATGAGISGVPFEEVSLINRGTISATSGAAGKALGVVLQGFQAGFNHGTIAAVGGDGSIAVDMWSTPRFTNTNIITADLAGGATGTATGVRLGNG